MRRIVWLALVTCLLAGSASAIDIPPRPEKLAFPGLTFDVPEASAFQVALTNGIPVYIAEDRLLPLITVQVYFRGGRYLEPDGKQGLASLTGTVWRSGGAGELDAKALDEELDFLAAQLGTAVGGTTGSVSLNLLAKDIDRGLALLMDVMLSPRFQADRLAKAKEEMLADMKRRNDDTGDIEEREWNRLLYGDAYWLNRLATRQSVEGITRGDLVAFQKRLVVPANLVVAVAGDFERQAMISKLNATLGAMETGAAPAPAVPQPDQTAEPAVYLVDKPDVNQARVSIGHMAALRPLEDESAVTVANDIFGGHGFTAWMMQRVRSDEGLAYSAYADFEIGDQYPGTFRAYFQTKSSTCNRASSLTVDLMKKLIAGEVGDEELKSSKNSFIERFPRTFESKIRTVTRYATDDLVGRSHEYWKTYRDRVRAVNAPAAQVAAKKHIHPDRLVVLVVGNIEEILKGHPDHPDIKLDSLGKLVRLSLRDPLTLEPLQ